MNRPLQTKLISIIEPVLNASGYDLVDIRFLLEQGGWVLRVAIDRPLSDATDVAQVPEDRVDLQACEDASRELSAVLDVEDPIPQAFSLEVSSPGIDRPLRTVRHFEHFVGSDAKIQLVASIQTPTGERKNFRGILAGVTDGKVGIEVDGQVFHLPIDDIDTAKLVPDWDAVMRGESGVGPKKAKLLKPGHQPSQKSKSTPTGAAKPNKQKQKEQG